jgi:hypothetical protein
MQMRDDHAGHCIGFDPDAAQCFGRLDVDGPVAALRLRIVETRIGQNDALAVPDHPDEKSRGSELAWSSGQRMFSPRVRSW